MAHVVTDKCNGCKFTDCVEVCPVACFYEMDTQVVIHADECIDCMACVDVCPVHAIYADADVPTEFTKDIEFNSVQANQIKDSGGEAITVKRCSAHRERAKKGPWLLIRRNRLPAKISEFVAERPSDQQPTATVSYLLPV